MDPPLPSTLTYKERLTMKSLDSNAYSKLFNNSNTQKHVWHRLSFDAGVRNSSSRALQPTPPEQLFAQQPRTSSFGQQEVSGFVSNTSRVVFDKFTPMKSGLIKVPGEVPVEALLPLQLRRFKQAYPMDYFSAIRPDAESTNQTLRMLGTYGSDFVHSDQARVFIPNGCPGGPASGSWYHPDIRLTVSACSTRKRYL